MRRLRTRALYRLRKRAAARPPGDPWAFRLEFAARRVARSLKRLEQRLEPGAAAAEPESVPIAGIARVRADQPLVVITQMARSGGTLLLHLFDGHPECLVVPHELSVMLPSRPLPRDAGAAFAMLTPKLLAKWRASASSGEFDVSPDVLRALFYESLAASPPSTDRDVLDAYFSSYFSAWQSRQGAGGAPSWVVGFEPGAIANAQRMDRFAANYPDGRVISVLRDPWTWFVSARRWSKRFAHVDVALSSWRRSIEQALVHHEERPGWIALVSFDDLALRPGSVLERLCGFLDISFDETLVVPTSNGQPIGDNSSFGAFGGVISTDPVLQRRSLLSDDLASVIEESAGPLWQRALDVLESQRSVA